MKDRPYNPLTVNFHRRLDALMHHLPQLPEIEIREISSILKSNERYKDPLKTIRGLQGQSDGVPNNLSDPTHKLMRKILHSYLYIMREI